MTFYPDRGTRSLDTFDSSSGAIFTNNTLQGIVGGHVTLLSTYTGTSSVIRNWIDINHWSLENNLYSRQTVSGVFNIISGSAIVNNTVTQSGLQGIDVNSRAWYINTDYPTRYSFGYSGQITQALYLGENSPNTGYAQSINDGSEEFTIEFDIASLTAYSGLTNLQGFTTGQNNLTGLPPLTGIIGHGVLIQTLNTWDYIETTPYGIRSFNHPELAIPIDLTTPKRVRIGVKDSDIYLSSEDGKAIYGLGKFDTTHYNAPTNPLIAFGAPFLGTYGTDTGGLTGVDGCYGYTFWDNIKILTGDLVINSTQENRIYSTGIVTMHTDEFDPNISINRFTNAVITYVPYKGGTTTIYSEYSGLTGWEVYNGITLDSSTNYTTLDLTNLPTFKYPRADFGIDYCNNPIRFRIDQNSTDGTHLPPAVESIEVFLNKERYQIDLVPDWKVAGISTQIKIATTTGTFLTDDPVPDTWTSLLFNTPRLTGVIAPSYEFTDETFNTIPIYSLGSTGSLVHGGFFGTAYQNYNKYSIVASSGTDAYSVFGNSSVDNVYPNPTFDGGFRAIDSNEARYSTGLTNGYLASYIEIGSNYTGTYRVDFLQNQVYRPYNQATRSLNNFYNQNTSTPSLDYVQGVDVYTSSLAHDGTVGIEAFIPSGIATGELYISFEIQISHGSGVQIYVTGDSTSYSSFVVPGDYARNYIPINFITNSTGNGELRIGFGIPNGFSGERYTYNIDNINVAPLSRSYLYATGITAYSHKSGIPIDTVGLSTYPPQRAATVFNTSLFLDSYPATQSGILARFTGDNLRGLEINIDSDGYLNAYFDQESNSWAGSFGIEPYYESLPRTKITSSQKVPLGQWTTIGFMHDVHTFNKFSHCSYTGSDDFPYNFTSANRGLLTINGAPVANVDLMTGWKGHNASTIYSDSAPFVSYIDLTGQVSALLVSGLMCKIDGLSLSRPPVAEAEAELAIKGARASTPYFVPDCLYKANAPTDIGNILYNTGNDTYASAIVLGIGRDPFLGSIYNFSSPGTTNWDHGHWKNHLIYMGVPTKEANCPYTGYDLPSTRFNTGAYAIARYSSTMERIFGMTGQLSITYTELKNNGLNQGAMRSLGWIYPRTTGTFFTVYENKDNLTGNRLSLAIDTGNYLVVNKYDSSTNSVVYSNTGHAISLNDWSFINFNYSQSYSAYHTTGGSNSIISTYFCDEDSVTSTVKIGTGIDYGFNYQGRTGSSYKSEIRFAEDIDANLFNWALYCPANNDSNTYSNGSLLFSTDGNKYGRYQTILDGSSLFTGTQSWDNFNLGTMILPATSGSRERFISIAAINTYDNVPKLNGILVFDNKPFKEVENYNLSYDLTRMHQTFGSTNSPIRIGSQVPNSAINIAKFASPALTVPASINTIDLSDQNVNNLITYKRGTYQVGSNLTDASVLTGFRNINTGLYAGRVDITCSGQIVSSDVNLTTLSVINSDGLEGDAGYYYYLIGRGQRGIKILDAYGHYTGNLNEYSTGSITDNYIANLEKIRASIKLRDRKGNDVTDQISFDIVTSSYTTNDLSLAVYSGSDLNLDNIGNQNVDLMLPDGVFSTILITNINRLSTSDSLFIHYNAYDFSTEEETPGYKEIVNPQPIFRERHTTESPDIGKFDLILNSNNYYDLKIYGIASGYSGKL